MKKNIIMGKDTARSACRQASIKAVAPLLLSLSAFILLLTLVSCGVGSGRFRIEGRFTNLNQGEFYVYSPDGGTDGLDTIKVADGRFAYETALDSKATFIIVFPNYSEQAVFGESGATVKISGDASHLKEMEITGTDDNEKLTDFRLNANRLSPPEVVKAVESFVNENTTSPVSVWLINKYLIQIPQPNYALAWRLAGVMEKADPDNGRVVRLRKQTESLKASATGGRLSDFSVKDIDGHNVKRSTLGGKVNVVSLWASWSYDSQKQARKLKALRKEYGNDLGLLTVCVDARAEDFRKRTERDSIDWPVVCDGKMWDTPLLKMFGLATVPGSVIADGNGKIIARNLNDDQMEQKIKSILKK